jgi:hypothetical protein
VNAHSPAETWRPAQATASSRSRFGYPLLIQFAITMAFAFACRAWQFGNPIIQIDEQFYLVVGERMLQGAVPFVDIWDRKPIGIFLIFAATRLLGGDGIIEYQIVATIFAGLTAFLIAAMAQRFANPRGATLAGCTYLVWLVVFDGAGGQTPVFYNALMAGAGALAMQALQIGSSSRRAFALTTVAMLLVGLALQIKYSAVFEGMFFGCALLWRWTRDPAGLQTGAVATAAWVGAALLPTVAVWARYAFHGFGSVFVYANFLSIFDRSGWPAATLVRRLAGIVALASPLLFCAWLEHGSVRREQTDDALVARRFAFGWLAAALGGIVVFGTYFTHYFLPALVSLCLVCATLLGDPEAAVSATVAGRRRAISFAWFVALSAAAILALSVPKRIASRGSGTAIRDVAAAIESKRTGCMLVFDGEPILYHLTDACTVTTRFPNHLNDATERGATGIDPSTEIARIFAVERPDILVASDKPDPRYNAETLGAVREAIRRHYRLIYRRTIGSRDRLVYKRLSDD